MAGSVAGLSCHRSGDHTPTSTAARKKYGKIHLASKMNNVDSFHYKYVVVKLANNIDICAMFLIRLMTVTVSTDSAIYPGLAKPLIGLFFLMFQTQSEY